MKYVVILREEATSLLIADEYFDACPPSTIYYNNTVHHPKVEDVENCGSVKAVHSVTGKSLTAKAVGIK